MALTKYHNWRVVGGSAVETNGGGFDPSLTSGMLTDGAATSATTAAPVFSSATYTFVAGDVGAAVYIASGTNWTPGWYPIVSVSAGAATLKAGANALAYYESPLLDDAIKSDRTPLTTAGCASTGSPTGATFSIDYSWIDTAPLSTTDLTSTASTTVTSALSTFTPVMVGNTLRIASGTGATTGYYAIVTYTNATTIVLDRTSGTYTLGVSKIGGGWLDPRNIYSTASGLTAPVVTTPLAAGHTIWIKGAGTNDSSTADYTVTAGYCTVVAGDSTSGPITWIGYNGRPVFSTAGVYVYTPSFHAVRHIKVKYGSSSNGTYGGFNGVMFFDVIIDMNGFDIVGMSGFGQRVYIKNTGATTAGTSYAYDNTSGSGGGWSPYGGVLLDSIYIRNVRGGGMKISTSLGVSARNCVISGCKGTATSSLYIGPTSYGHIIQNFTIDGGAGHGISVASAAGLLQTYIQNTIISNHAGASKYGIECNFGSTISNDLAISGKWTHNNLYGNTTARLNVSAHPTDLALDPTYTDSANGDFSIGTNLKAKGYPNQLAV